MRVRTKPCAQCQQTAETLFRVRRDQESPWIFVCETCLPSLKDGNPNYVYGGTWKAVRER